MNANVRKPLALAAATAAVLLSAAMVVHAAEVKPGSAAPAFTLTDQDGKSVSLADYAGKIVVLEWINPDCPFSRRHHQRGALKALGEKYGPKGVVVLAGNSTHYWTAEKNKEWAEKNKLTYPVLTDSPGTVGMAYDAKTTPDMRVIDAKGIIAYMGAIDDDPGGKKDSPLNYVAQALDEMLAGKEVSTPRTKPYGCSVKYPPKK
jgi:peroxiredoxin